MVPTHLRSLRLRVANMQAKVKILNKTNTQMTIFINSEACLTESKFRDMDVQAYTFYYRVP